MVCIPNIKHLICLLSASRYLTNPRYLLLVPGPGGEEEEGEGEGAAPVMVVVSLMQKNRRQMYDEGEDQLLIGFEVFEVDIIVDVNVVFTQCATPGGGAGGGALLALCSEGGAHCAAGGGRALPAGGGAVYLHIYTYLHISTYLLYVHRYVIVCHAHTGAGRGQARAGGEFYLRCVVGVGPGRQGSQLRALQQEETHL